MGVSWRGLILFVLSSGIVLGAAAGPPRPMLSAPAGDRQLAVLDRDQEIFLLVTPHAGDALTRLALRTTGDAGRWKEISALNAVNGSLSTDRPLRVPFSLLKHSLRLQVIRALFPEDQNGVEGWRHKVVLSGAAEGESFWKIAEWFTGDGANYGAIRKANKTEALSTRAGQWVLIPRKLLAEPFRATAPDLFVRERKGVQAAEKARTNVRPIDSTAGLRSEGKMGNENEARPSRVLETKPASSVPEAKASVTAVADPSSSSEPSPLLYARAAERPFATYRMKKGEALYSSVAIRFTGRVFAKDVNKAVDEIVAFNKIADVARIPVGYVVKIPMELLTAEYRPLTDPRRAEKEQSKRESAKLATAVEAKNLQGVLVILDAGHGGRDVGTTHDDLWESSYVYDIACRIRKVLEQNSQARVFMTTKSDQAGHDISPENRLPQRSDHKVMTNPEYRLEDPVIGVNLRWYLANSIFRRALKAATRAEKVIFISVHADSLHPSLRGAMMYVPGEKFVRGKFEKTGTVYLTRSEVRENPSVTQTREEALRAEGLSTRFAESLVRAFKEDGLEVHPYNPIRDNVVRDGKEWVPAIIRYNKVPTRLLLEVCNLGNRDDRELVQTKRYRQRVAQAVFDGLIDFFGEGESESRESLVKTAAK